MIDSPSSSGDFTESVLRGIEKKILSELSKTNEELSEHFTLDKLPEEDVEVRLKSGEVLVLERKDISKVKSRIPDHLKAKLKLPVEISIIVSGEQVIYKIEGDLWQIRMVKYLQSGTLSWKPSDGISREDVSELLRSYPSLIRLKLIVR